MAGDSGGEVFKMTTPLAAAGVDVHGFPIACCDEMPECSHVYYCVQVYDAMKARVEAAEADANKSAELAKALRIELVERTDMFLAAEADARQLRETVVAYLAAADAERNDFSEPGRDYAAELETYIAAKAALEAALGRA